MSSKKRDAGMGALTALGLVASALGYAWWQSREPAKDATPTTDLSPKRVRALELVSGVVPSKYGDARFATMAPAYRPDDPKLPKGFTTCGYLPGYVGSKLGINTRYGLASIRTLGEANGAWVVARPGLRPLPGDFFLLGVVGKPGEISHTGIVVDPYLSTGARMGDLWRTADAGQGSREAQEARFVERPFDEVNMTLGGPAGTRPLLGWYDIDKG